MVCPTNVNGRAGTVTICRAKDAEWLRPKEYRGRLLRRRARCTRTLKTAGVLAGTTPLVSSMRNRVNPMSRFCEGAGVPIKGADGQRAEDAGESKGRSVMERVGVAPSSAPSRRCESRPTSSWSFVTRETGEPPWEGMVNERSASCVWAFRRSAAVDSE